MLKRLIDKRDWLLQIKSVFGNKYIMVVIFVVFKYVQNEEWK